jgi:DNA-directed RNA polymerase specialized sigma24 family protein
MMCLDLMPSRLGIARGKGIKFVDIDLREPDGEPVVQVEDGDPSRRPDYYFEALEEEERVFLLQTAMTRYTGPRCQEVLRLHIRELREELSREEVAEALSVSVERAGHMIYDCLYRLRKEIQKKFRDYQQFSDCVYNRGHTTRLRIFKKE